MIKIGVTGIIIVITILAQVSIAPLLPISGALIDTNLLVIVFISSYLSRKIALGALLFLTLLAGSITNISYEWIFLAYLPAILLIHFFGLITKDPSPHLIRILAVGAITGIWARILMSLVAFSEGASISLITVFTQILAPGILMDILAIAIFYGIFQIVGLNKSYSISSTTYNN